MEMARPRRRGGSQRPPVDHLPGGHPHAGRCAAGLQDRHRADLCRCGVPCVPVALNSGLFWPRRTFMRYPGTLVVEFLDPLPPGLPRKEFIARITTVDRGRHQPAGRDRARRAGAVVRPGAGQGGEGVAFTRLHRSGDRSSLPAHRFAARGFDPRLGGILTSTAASYPGCHVIAQSPVGIAPGALGPAIGLPDSTGFVSTRSVWSTFFAGCGSTAACFGEGSRAASTCFGVSVSGLRAASTCFGMSAAAGCWAGAASSVTTAADAE